MGVQEQKSSLSEVTEEFFKLSQDQNQKGMSLIEIIIVIALMGTLMAIVLQTLTGKQETAMEDAAKLAMAQLDNDLQMFKVHNYKYPTTDQGLQALVTEPGSSKRWRGPYTEKKKLKDPWGNEFSYESADGSAFKIISPGIDGNLGTEDDISYPEEEEAEE